MPLPIHIYVSGKLRDEFALDGPQIENLHSLSVEFRRAGKNTAFAPLVHAWPEDYTEGAYHFHASSGSLGTPGRYDAWRVKIEYANGAVAFTELAAEIAIEIETGSPPLELPAIFTVAQPRISSTHKEIAPV